MVMLMFKLSYLEVVNVNCQEFDAVNVKFDAQFRRVCNFSGLELEIGSLTTYKMSHGPAD